MPRLLFFIILLLFSLQKTYSQEANLTLELRRVNLADAVRLIANSLHINVIISPDVQGSVSMHLRATSPEQALEMLLTTQGLASWRQGKIWYIAQREELIKRKQEEQKWQETSDATAYLSAKVWQLSYAKADEVGKVIQDSRSSLLSKRGKLTVDVRTNSLYVEDTETQINKIRKFVAKLDVPVQQIAIMARLASVDSAMKRELGIDFSIINQKGANPVPGHYSLAIVELADASLLDVKLAALENAGYADLISRPSLFTANQQTASIEAGEEVPYQQVSESGGTAIVFKKAVLGLKVTPQILPGKKVLLQLQINQDRPSGNMVLGMPTITTRQIITNVLVRNGQTVVLGGIYETNSEKGEARIPFIYRIPVVGWLFRQQTLQRNKRELLIFVTPKIIT